MVRNPPVGILTAADAMLLAFAQLAQPASCQEVYAAAQGTELTLSLSETAFAKCFERLARDRYLWRTDGERYIVTPLGEAIALTSFSAQERDKLRLLILNRRRYEK